MMVFDRSTGHYRTAGWLGTRSIVNIPNKEWIPHRKVFQQAFQPDKLDKSIPIMTRKADEMNALIRKTPDDWIDMCDLYLRLSTDVTGCWAFDYDPKALTLDAVSEVHEAIVFAHFHWNKRIWSAVPHWVFESGMYMGDEVKEFKRTNEKVYEIIYKIIDDRQSREVKEDATDLLSVLMFHDKDRCLTRQELAENMYTMFTATMNAPCVLEWCIALLSKHRDYEEKLRAEIKTAFGDSKSSADITPERLEKLVYMRQYINESMRVHMPARAPMMRTCTEDFVLPGSKIKVPKNTEVVFCPASIAMMEEKWPEPEKFKPDRWPKEEKVGAIPDYNYSFLPFEAGRRACLGRHFAFREVMVLFTHFLMNFEATEIDCPFTHEKSVICRPDHLKCKLKYIGA
jgi:cytochrome P450